LPVNRDIKSWTWTAQVTQPLIRWASWVNVTQATKQIEQATAQFALAEQDLMLRTAQTYFDIMLAEENIRVAEAQLSAVNEQLVLAERNFAVGTGIITDIYEAKTKRGSAQSQRIAALNELASKQADLDRILGDTLVLKPTRIAQNLPAMQTAQLGEWLRLASQQNIQVKIQQAAMDVANRETSKSLSAHAPTLDLTLNQAGAYNSGSLSSPADLTTRTRSHQAGLLLTVPLYAGGATQSKVRESLLLEDKAYEDLIGAKRSANTQVRQAFAGVMNGQAQIEALQAAVESGVQAVEANKIGFKIGTRINPDVLNAEQQLYSAMRDLMKARVDAVMQGLKLKAASGALQAQDLAALDALL
jgi:outer membrane protein